MGACEGKTEYEEIIQTEKLPYPDGDYYEGDW